MAVIHIRALGGGIGTSTFAWCLAREFGSLLIDQSIHRDGVKWVAGADSAWPRVVGSGDLSPMEYEQFESSITQIHGVGLCAGGVPPASPVIRQIIRSAPLDRDIVIDGNATDAVDESWFSIVVASNSIPHMRELESISADFIVCSLQNQGVPKSIVSHLYPRAYLFKKQRRVDRGIHNGFGVDDHSDVTRCAAQIKHQLLVGSQQ
jgi:hypothetical protein